MTNDLKKQVQRILVDFPDTRNSDVALTIKIWQVFYGVEDSVQVKSLYELPREDNVKRIRAKFCEQGFVWAFPTEWKIARARKIKENEWRIKLGYSQLPSGAMKSVYFEVRGNVVPVPENQVDAFLKLNPNAIRL